jgi:hypothetical protein
MDEGRRLPEWIDAYLEWIEAADSAGEALREAVLLDALHMESECVHIVNQILDRGSRSPEALELALDTLRAANDLLADESRAWHLLRARKQWRLALTPRAAWENQLDYRWSEAIDHVAIDVQALAGRVLALQSLRA